MKCYTHIKLANTGTKKKLNIWQLIFFHEEVNIEQNTEHCCNVLKRILKDIMRSIFNKAQ